MIAERTANEMESTNGDAGPVRVALLTNENPPYRIPLYRALAETPNWDFRVFTCVDREHGRQWDVERADGFFSKRVYSLSYRRAAQGGDAIHREPAQIHIPVGLSVDLFKHAPDVMISDEFGARSVIAAMYATLARKRLIIYSEGTLHTEREIGRPQRIVRRLLRKRSRAYLCNGKEGRKHLEQIGIPDRDIFEIGQAIDADSFQSPLPPEEREALRRKLGVTGLCYLYVGRMTAQKGVDQLMEAWKAFCRQHGVEATLLLVGDGEMKEQLEQRAKREKLNNVRLLGFVQRRELPPIYQAADVFVFPTLVDCWSLAVGEAMAAGLPIIGSKYDGGAEMVASGRNGWIADPANREDLEEKLHRAWEARDRMEEMGNHSKRIVSTMTIDNVAERIRAAVEHTIARSGSPGT